MMRKEIYTIGFSLLLLLWGGCSDFLKETSQDEMKPATTNDLEQLLLGEGYLRTGYLTNYLDLLTDDVESHYTTDQTHAKLLTRGAAVFGWQKDMYEQLALQSVPGRNTWEIIYAKIKGCNVVLDMVEDVHGSQEEKANLRGQALAMRAYYYFILVNLYGQPYNAEGVDITTSPGVPLILEAAVKDEFPPRASVARVYEQVEKDLLAAAPLIEKYGQKNYKLKVTDLFVHTLLSRMYLYQEKWEKAKEHADYVLTRKPELVNLADYAVVNAATGKVSVDWEKGGVYNINSIELIWGYSTRSEYGAFHSSLQIGHTPAYQVSEELSGLYRQEDLRAWFYYERYIISMDWTTWVTITGMNYGRKCADNASHPYKGMRVAELYLNRAEANIRLYLEHQDASLREAALKDLNYLRSRRFQPPYVEVTAETVGDLLQFCREERRRELSFEDHRWYDLRRYGMPALEHVLTFTEGQPETYSLPAKSERYVLPIAQEVIDKNPALIQNP